MTRNPHFYVYVYECLDNGKKYVGKGQKRRIEHHMKNKTSLLSKAILKHGWERFRIVKVCDGMDEDEAFDLEKELIARYWTNVCREYEPGVFGHGYNMTDGGDGISGMRHSSEAKAKIAAAASAVHRGRPLSYEHRQRIGHAHKGRYFSDEHRSKIAMTLKGRKHSLETRRKCSDATRRRTRESYAAVSSANAKRKGQRLSLEHREKIGATRRETNARKRIQRQLDHLSRMMDPTRW